MTRPRYDFPARSLHWVVAALVVVQLVLGFAADWASDPDAAYFFDNHIRIGLLVLSLMSLRLLWRLANPPPRNTTLPRWQQWIANMVHCLLYLLLFVLPVSGYVLWAWIGRPLDWFGLFSIPILFEGGEDETWRSIAGYTHSYAGLILMALLVMHIGAALWHEFVKGDQLISQRML
jgi:cytochrome b561